jgi:hypothetical protein
LPYRSKLFPGVINWTDSTSFWQNNCVATSMTNGMSINATMPSSSSVAKRGLESGPDVRIVKGTRAAFKQGRAMNIMMDDVPPGDILLPAALTPQGNLSTSNNVTQFFFLPDNKTGVLALGSFDDDDFDLFEMTLLNGLMDLKSRGAAQLIVDIVRASQYSAMVRTS